MNREAGPYFVNGSDGEFGSGQGDDPDIIDYNRPPEGQPGLWCQWVPNADGTRIVWDGNEKFYYAENWMKYLIDHFLKPGAEASKADDPQFDNFTFDHYVNGTIEAQGEDPNDRWDLCVDENEVLVRKYNPIPAERLKPVLDTRGAF